MRFDHPPALWEFPPGCSAHSVNTRVGFEPDSPPIDAGREVIRYNIDLDALWYSRTERISVRIITFHHRLSFLPTLKYLPVGHVEKIGRFPKRNHVRIKVMPRPSGVLIAQELRNQLNILLVDSRGRRGSSDIRTRLQQRVSRQRNR